jgi:putative thioredoxin
MLSSEFILDVTEKSFEFEVLYYSKNIPVIVDFWATWCQPCKQLSPMLEAVVTEADGQLRLARVDVDKNQSLAMQYQIRTIPTVIAFQDGKVMAEFSGLISQSELDDFIQVLLPPSQINLDLEKGESLLALHEWQQAADVFINLSKSEDCPPAAILGLAKAYIPIGKVIEANKILKNFPASKEYLQAESLLPLTVDLLNPVEIESDLDAMYGNCMRLVLRGNIMAALDGLLEILKLDRNYRKGKAKFAFLGLLELLGKQDDKTSEYRSELSTILFK